MLINTVTPKEFPRRPGANTIAYYPLTATTTGTDQSGNGFDLTNGGGVTFGTYNGVDCGYFSGNNCLKRSSGDIINNGKYTFTWLAWMYFINAGTNIPRIFTCYQTSGGYFILQNSGKIVIFSASTTNGITYQTGGWHLYVITGNTNTGQYTGYVDTVATTWTGTGASFGSGLCVGGTNSYSDVYNGYMSNVIFENKIWTSDEISKYYNQTKSNYGL